MTYYTKQEEIQLNKQLRQLQKKQISIVERGTFDNELPLSEIEQAVWRQIANAKTHKDVNWIAWDMAGKVINSLYKIRGK